MTITALRQAYHRRLFTEVIRFSQGRGGLEYPNFADAGNAGSMAIASHIITQLGYEIGLGVIAGQTSGGRFESATKDFLEACFALLGHLRPGEWRYATYVPISVFDQYAHLATLSHLIQQYSELAATLGTDYIIKPDITVSRAPFAESDINLYGEVVNLDEAIARLTPLRSANSLEGRWILHASISCKWTIRSDRAQNARAEALNLIRNRKGRLPHIVAVTAEPLPTRINSLALGTGDLDCVYHFALPELQTAVAEVGNQDQREALAMLIGGRRLRDISDLPFDLMA
ncbi:MAG: restriction endonuclease [Ardenticatenales bacterium]|nr:restriction endonuclease [Ardenticatenales bacterium]